VTTDRRCPECGSLARPDAGWCSLCHADLRSEEEKAAARPEREPTGTADEEPLSTYVPEWASRPDPTPATNATRGRHARPVDGPEPVGAAGAAALTTLVASSTAATDADAALAKAGIDVQSMLSLLAAGEPDSLSPITGRLSSKGSRAIAATVATVALIAFGIIAMFVLGSFVH
jgi:hypothetical protein